MTTPNESAPAGDCVLVPCHYCGAPCREVVLERGGDNGWGDDKSRTVRKYATPKQSTVDELRERLLGLADALDRRRYPENATLIREAIAALSPAIAPGGVVAVRESMVRHWLRELNRGRMCDSPAGDICGHLHASVLAALNAAPPVGWDHVPPGYVQSPVTGAIGIEHRDAPQDGEADQPVGDALPLVVCEEGDGGEETMVVLVGGIQVFGTNHDAIGWIGMEAVTKAVEAVYAALLAAQEAARG